MKGSLSSLGRRLRYARLSKGLRQVQLAKLVHTFPQVIGDYERGRRGNLRPDLVLLLGIAKALGISLDWLLLGEGDGPAPHKLSPKTGDKPVSKKKV